MVLLFITARRTIFRLGATNHAVIFFTNIWCAANFIGNFRSATGGSRLRLTLRGSTFLCPVYLFKFCFHSHCVFSTTKTATVENDAAMQFICIHRLNKEFLHFYFAMPPLHFHADLFQYGSSCKITALIFHARAELWIALKDKPFRTDRQDPFVNHFRHALLKALCRVQSRFLDNVFV
jgi:hypothetical protein